MTSHDIISNTLADPILASGNLDIVEQFTVALVNRVDQLIVARNHRLLDELRQSVFEVILRHGDTHEVDIDYVDILTYLDLVIDALESGPVIEPHQLLFLDKYKSGLRNQG